MVDGFGIGSLSSGPVLVGVGDFSYLQGVRIDAIVGLDVLARTSFAIDYRARVVELAPAASTDAAIPRPGPPVCVESIYVGSVSDHTRGTRSRRGPSTAHRTGTRPRSTVCSA